MKCNHIISVEDKIKYAALPSFFKARTKRLPIFDLVTKEGQPLSKRQQKLEYLKMCVNAYRLQQSYPNLEKLQSIKESIPHTETLKHMQVDLAIAYQESLTQENQMRLKIWLMRYFKGGPNK